MTVSYGNAAIREVLAGIVTSRAANASPLASANLFTISGGRILLVALYGEVTTIIQAQATTVKFTSTPTTGSATDLSSAATDLTGKEAGAHITLGNPPAAATAVQATVAGYINLPSQRTLIPPGVISVTYGAASTGAIKYDLIWIPYDPAVTVVAD